MLLGCLFCLVLIPFAESKDTNSSSINIHDLHQTGVFCEDKNQLQKGIIYYNKQTGKNEIFLCGKIEKITWKSDIPLEEIQKRFNLKEGQMLDWHESQQILIFLELQTGNLHKLSIKLTEENNLNVCFEKQIKEKYFIQDIKITGNKVLSNEDILEVSGISTLNIIEKCKYLILGQSSAEFKGPQQTQHIEQAIKNLGQKHLLSDIKAHVYYVIDLQDEKVTIYINIQEGTKYFIENIHVEGCKISLAVIKDYIDEYGLQGGNFQYLSNLLFNEYNISNLNINYTCNGCYINIFVTKQETHLALIVENILFKLPGINVDYLVKHCKIRIGEFFNEWDIKKFCRWLSMIYEKTIVYKIDPYKDKQQNKIIVTIYEEEKKDKTPSLNIFSYENGSFLLQYPLCKHWPWLKLTFTPKVPLSTDMLSGHFKIGGELNIVHHISEKTSFKPFNLLGFLNLSNITNIKSLNDVKNIVQSFKIHLLTLDHHNKRYNFNMSLSLLGINKYYHIHMPALIKEHMYYYSNLALQKNFIFNNKCAIALNGLAYIFYHPKSAKVKFTPEFLIPFTNKINLVISLKSILNSQNFTRNDYFKHFSSINKSDSPHGLLWGDDYDGNESHLEINKEQAHHNTDKLYLYNKGIVLSHLIFNVRFLLNFILFKIPIPSFGDILLLLILFFNINYDVTNAMWRMSLGVGVGVKLHKMLIVFAMGCRHNLTKPNEKDKDMKYSFNIEAAAF